MLTSGISLILIGMMISNFQLMIIGLSFISMLAINGWVSGHSELTIRRETSATNVYKGDDIVSFIDHHKQLIPKNSAIGAIR